ncbi:hypothetical protein SAMN05216266_107231 [Amycolatopsis marina]|uniref:LPXTG-motif cell wall anchor domain-containing protein n=1 Tax=Amycolatopsis marina TaxID=490629 RepID=A0A1I0ZRH7_9PSEU|nr:hypothetical protein [Amycolatopsis marina]SFB28334.1 hypothetical protein SAMN05216266_107231 [Amycolatopsis marina]
MTRSVIRMVGCAAVLALAAVPGVAAAQDVRTVDAETGPVAFANAVAVKVGEDGQGGGTVITETQRSPVSPGGSKLSQDRSTVPASDGEKNAIGPHYAINLGRFEPGASPFPAGVTSREHNIVATLRDTTVPAAVAESNYALRDLRAETAEDSTITEDSTTAETTEPSGGAESAPGSSVASTVLAFEGARSAVECAAADDVTAETTADALWVLGEDGELAPAELPRGDAELRLENLPLGAPLNLQDADDEHSTSDVVVRRVTEFDQLLRQEKWRGGDVTAAAGWHVEIISQLRDAEGEDLGKVVRTRMVFGGVSCSLPHGFAALPPRSQQRPAVPIKIPAGVSVQESGQEPLGYALVGAGLVLGAAALLVRRPARRRGCEQVRQNGE